MVCIGLITSPIDMFPNADKSMPLIEGLGRIIVLPNPQPDRIITRLLGMLHGKVHKDRPKALAFFAGPNINALDFQGIVCHTLFGLGSTYIELEVAHQTVLLIEEEEV